MRIAAVADLHCRVNEYEQVATLVEGIQEKADVLILAGDLTDNGLAEEVDVLCEQIAPLSIPVLAVLGNHDHEGGQSEAIAASLQDAGVTILEANGMQIGEVGFVGTKGFCGGFGRNLVQPFGESALKTFIRSSIDEAVQLENALAKLSACTHRVVVLHYAPVVETLEGEPPEIFAFLGTSRLENAIDRHGADVIFHGHAHHGSPLGKTAGNIPVYNVSRFVLQRTGDLPYCLFELSA